VINGVVVMDVFDPDATDPGGEVAKTLTARIPMPSEAKAYAPSWSDVPPRIVAGVGPGDVVLTMGGPPIGLMPGEILAALAATAT
jgi:UDP-N-acetylmuramate--alanine ligase